MVVVRVSVFTLFVLYIHCFMIGALSQDHENVIDSKVLDVGEELWKETLPLQMGSRFYDLHGLRPSKWYEVKISYPASIPASFSIHLKRNKSSIGVNLNRRLLNTEKLIFKVDDNYLSNGQDGLYALVVVEPAGVVAIPHAQERKHVMFNIVCDELSLGIPHEAWWVVSLVFVCVVLAFIIPYFLPPLLYKNQSSCSGNLSKDS